MAAVQQEPRLRALITTNNSNNNNITLNWTQEAVTAGAVIGTLAVDRWAMTFL
jgi:hypothetical protein